MLTGSTEERYRIFVGQEHKLPVMLLNTSLSPDCVLSLCFGNNHSKVKISPSKYTRKEGKKRNLSNKTCCFNRTQKSLYGLRVQITPSKDVRKKKENKKRNTSNKTGCFIFKESSSEGSRPEPLLRLLHRLDDCQHIRLQ